METNEKIDFIIEILNKEGIEVRCDKDFFDSLSFFLRKDDEVRYAKINKGFLDNTEDMCNALRYVYSKIPSKEELTFKATFTGIGKKK